jgi:ABC-type glycerol-3-phosphate transport system substrate-binding protein
MYKRLVGSFCVVLLVLFTFSTILVGSVFAAEEVTINVWGWPGSNEALQLSLSGFNKLYPNIKVNFVKMAWQDVHQKLQIVLAAGSGAPDVSWVDGQQLQKFIKFSGLVDVTETISESKKDFVEYKIAEASDENGRIYAFPMDIGPVVLYYNRDIFSKYAIKPPTTWSEFILSGRKLKAQGISMLHLPKLGDSSFLNILIQQAGGSLFNQAGKATFNTPQVLEGIKTYLDIYRSGIGADVARDWSPAMWDSLRSGNVATYIEALWMINVFPDYMKTPEQGFGKWRAAYLPLLSKDKVTGANNGGSNLVIPAQTKNKEAALAFCKYSATSIEGQRFRAAFGVVPATISALKDQQIVDKEYSFFGGQKVMGLALEAARRVLPTYFRPAAYSEATTVLTNELPKLMRGEMTAKQFVAYIQSKFEDIVKKY